MVDSKFGEGIARGTVPLEKGDGVNVQVRGSRGASRPASEATMLESHRAMASRT